MPVVASLPGLPVPIEHRVRAALLDAECRPLRIASMLPGRVPACTQHAVPASVHQHLSDKAIHLASSDDLQ